MKTKFFVCWALATIMLFSCEVASSCRAGTVCDKSGVGQDVATDGWPTLSSFDARNGVRGHAKIWFDDAQKSAFARRTVNSQSSTQNQNQKVSLVPRVSQRTNSNTQDCQTLAFPMVMGWWTLCLIWAIRTWFGGTVGV